MRRVLITGGAGFVGANLAVGLAGRHPDWEVLALDNLHRRGSELNLSRLEDAGVAFIEADVRDPDKLMAIEPVEALVECSAEPSVLSGLDGDTGYLVHTNLTGAYNCLELARRDDAQFVFLSTSRVYPYGPLSSIALEETPTRYEIAPEQALAGVSPAGVSESFPLEGARTLYGATKLAAELLVTEYADSFAVRAVVDRCGVIAGPWQMGKADQGVFSHWLLSHLFEEPLSYIGYGGSGRQVRDLLHVDDLVELLDEQLGDPDGWAGETFNVGGGRQCSLSLLETTQICRDLTANEVPIEADPDTRPGDIPVYLSDSVRLFERTAWRPKRDAAQTMRDIFEWVSGNSDLVGRALGFRA
jgi:CDP-paratose 2-epimerase